MLRYEVDSKSESIFCIFLNAFCKEYKVSRKGGKAIFEIKKPAFSQDEVTISLFYNELARL